MSTLLIRLAAPLQAWGSDAKFERRGTERTPTKSGVLGLIAAGLGRKRNDSIDDLLTLRFGVRVEQEGYLLRDFQTARRDKLAYITNRYYLSDALFLAGLEGDETLLHTIDNALKNPAFPLYLGRRSCPPSGQVSLGIRSGVTLLDALQMEPPLNRFGKYNKQKDESATRIVYDAGTEDASDFFQRDLPITFNIERRKHGFRRVVEIIEAGQSQNSKEEYIQVPSTSHDPFAGWEED